MVGYAIICNARRGRWLGIEYIALAKSRGGDGWWSTTDQNSVLLIPTLEEAQRRLESIRLNDPRIIPYERACKIMRDQAASVDRERIRRENEAAMDDPSWDAHKTW